MKRDPKMSIGEVAKRTGVAVSAIRFYESRKLLPSVRSAGGKRLFSRSVIRRVSFILISQRLGYTLEEIDGLLSTLPEQRTPTKADWQRLSRQFSKDIDDRIAGLTQLKESLTGCIGCGCLSLQSCQLYNPMDTAAENGDGPRYLMGDKPGAGNQ
ncbi:redox-sensitive transcriptional activator SoxR [Chromatiales bacterium (ex Bugula neritina AB1)]|nr:redox-sensitive transcriptional activator SoxR [Chromatiales bacterium (ex Bugula neritina AB1)]